MSAMYSQREFRGLDAEEGKRIVREDEQKRLLDTRKAPLVHGVGKRRGLSEDTPEDICNLQSDSRLTGSLHQQRQIGAEDQSRKQKGELPDSIQEQTAQSDLKRNGFEDTTSRQKRRKQPASQRGISQISKQ